MLGTGIGSGISIHVPKTRSLDLTVGVKDGCTLWFPLPAVKMAVVEAGR